MQRMTSGLSRSVAKWVSQVAASVGATLAATLIWSAVPHPGATAPAPAPALTEGGKFAARAAPPAAYDGLDEMPLPRVAPSASAVPPLLEVAPPRRIAADWVERPSHPAHAPRPPLRTALRHAAPAEPAARPIAAEAASIEPAPEGAPAPGMLPRLLPAVLSTARSAWSLTASAGDALVSRLASPIP